MTNPVKSQVVFFTVMEVAKLLKTTPKTIRSYIASNLITAHQLPNNGSYRIQKSKLIEFIDGLRVDK
jgi:excisionase family DNA binding protein